MSIASTEIVTSASPAPLTLRQQVQAMEHQFALAAPRGVEARQIVRDVLTALSQNPELAKCDPQTVLGGAMTMAQLGLRVGVLGHGWLLPFRARAMVDGKWVSVYKAQLIIGYKGFVALAYRSQQVEKITARTVRENDHFDLEYGLNEHLTHRPATSDRGNPVGYYATVRLKGSTDSMFYYLTHDEMCVYRDRYAMAKKDGEVVGPWASEFEGMAHKTCLRQLSKYMPMGTDLASGLAADDTVRVDLSPTADIAHVSEHLDPEPDEQTVRVGDDTVDGQVQQ